jgi:hypothetical protein
MLELCPSSSIAKSGAYFFTVLCFDNFFRLLYLFRNMLADRGFSIVPGKELNSSAIFFQAWSFILFEFVPISFESIWFLYFLMRNMRAATSFLVKLADLRRIFLSSGSFISPETKLILITNPTKSMVKLNLGNYELIDSRSPSHITSNRFFTWFLQSEE